jgi:surface antigen
MRRLPVLSAVLLAAFSAGAARAAESLDPADEAFRAASFRQSWTAPLGAELRWTNPVSGHAGTVRPLKERLDPNSHQPCREVIESLSAGDRLATGYAVGCRGADGTWRIVQASTAGPQAAGPVPADLAPYVPPADIAADGSGTGDPWNLPDQARILIPWRGAPGAVAPAPR